MMAKAVVAGEGASQVVVAAAAVGLGRQNHFDQPSTAAGTAKDTY